MECLQLSAHEVSESHVKRSLEILFHSDSPYTRHSAQKTLLHIAESLKNSVAFGAFLPLLWNGFEATQPCEMGTTCTMLLFRDILKLCHKEEDLETLSLFLDYLADNISLLRNRIGVSELGVGALLRLLCTVLHVLEQQHEQKTLPRFLFLEKVKRNLPELVESCVQDVQGFSTCRFIRYKAMMVVYRLSKIGSSEYGCFQLKLIADVLNFPLSCSENTGGSTLTELSPFSVKIDSLFSPDLQRRGILVLLKTVVKANGSISMELSSLAGGVLSEWLSRQLKTEGASLNDVVLSLVHLYVDEDDMFLDLLSTLMDFRPFWYEGDLYVKFMSAVSPLRLFHLFLAALHYDHSVMLDFLISESSGITFLQYLLRCLRLVKESGSQFLSSAHSFESEKKTSRTEFQHLSFLQAKQCLLSFQEAIERLHARKLFPYNASALLLRLRQVNIFLRETETETK